MNFVNQNIQTETGYGPDYGPRYEDPMGRFGVAVTHVQPAVQAEKPRLEPNVADWDKTLFARDVARQAMLKAGVNPCESL